MFDNSTGVIYKQLMAVVHSVSILYLGLTGEGNFVSPKSSYFPPNSRK